MRLTIFKVFYEELSTFSRFVIKLQLKTVHTKKYNLNVVEVEKAELFNLIFDLAIPVMN